MRFRPCIDLHEGKVKQIVGSSLKDGDGNALKTNFEASLPPAYFADLYFQDGLEGGHVIMLGKNNDAAALEAVSRHPGNLQVGGGVTPDNARQWLDAGAGKVIVTSYIFEDGELSFKRLEELAKVVKPEELVLDVSCRMVEGGYRVACNRWQTICNAVVNGDLFKRLSEYCSEYLVHAVDVEGKQAGIDENLVALLANECTLPVTYAGGARSMQDVQLLKQAGQGRIDVTVGSALDIFGGNGIKYSDIVAFDKANR